MNLSTCAMASAAVKASRNCCGMASRISAAHAPSSFRIPSIETSICSWTYVHKNWTSQDATRSRDEWLSMYSHYFVTSFSTCFGINIGNLYCVLRTICSVLTFSCLDPDSFRCHTIYQKFKSNWSHGIIPRMRETRVRPATPLSLKGVACTTCDVMF